MLTKWNLTNQWNSWSKMATNWRNVCANNSPWLVYAGLSEVTKVLVVDNEFLLVY